MLKIGVAVNMGANFNLWAAEAMAAVRYADILLNKAGTSSSEAAVASGCILPS